MCYIELLWYKYALKVLFEWRTHINKNVVERHGSVVAPFNKVICFFFDFKQRIDMFLSNWNSKLNAYKYYLRKKQTKLSWAVSPVRLIKIILFERCWSYKTVVRLSEEKCYNMWMINEDQT